MNSTPSNKASAFTLVELLISISMIAIMAAVSISAYPKFSEQTSITSETYKMLAYMRETQTYGVSSVSTPGTKFVYAFLIDKDNGMLSRVQIQNPSTITASSSYYIDSYSADSSAETFTIKPLFEIINVIGYKSNTESELDTAYSFFRRPNPEARLIGLPETNVVEAPGQNTISSSYILPDRDKGSFERIEVTLASRRDHALNKKIVMLQTGQMYVKDW
jgi:type II secretory pathway pseudopilin PulG